MSVADKLGFGPKREVRYYGEGKYEIIVTPPAFMNLPPQKVHLNKKQMDGYLAWQNDGVLIQEALPSLFASQREILMTGICDDDFHEMFHEKENEE